ncbi:MAG: type II secretion system protein [Colwellia sp.]|nr:type II secretion system protein [Colwellia sp.]
MSIKLSLSHQQGFTLLEIVLVLFLLGLMASSTLFLTQGVEDQTKYDETKHRLKMIRTAIIGDSSRTINGHPEVSGFAADMGRLPECLRELLSQRYCDNREIPLPTWQQDLDSQVWAGWRGPYLTGDTELSGEVHFRDGYGNSGEGSGEGSDDWQNSGWVFPNILNDFIVVSHGFDRLDDSDDVPRPFAVQALITPADYQVTLGADWQDIDVTFTNEQTNHIVIAQDELRLRLSSPSEGIILSYTNSKLDTTAERDSSAQLSNSFPSEDTLLLSKFGTMEVENAETLTFVSGATLTTGSPNDSVTLTSGTVITYTDSAGVSSKFVIGSNCAPNCKLTFPTGKVSPLTTSVTTLTFSGTTTLIINNHYIAPAILSAKNLTKPAIILPAGSTLLSNTVSLPNGANITFTGTAPQLVDRTVFFQEPLIIVSQAFTRTDNTIIIASGDTFTIPSNTPAAVGNTLTIPASSTFSGGEKSFTIVCEVGAEQGLLFDGNCDDGTVNNTDNPKSISLIPRNTSPVNNSVLTWAVQ